MKRCLMFTLLCCSLFFSLESRLLAEVILSTDKSVYKEGEEVRIVVKNNSSEESYIMFEPYRIEKLKGGIWQEINILWCPCGAKCKVSSAINIPSYGAKRYQWNQAEGKCVRSREKRVSVDTGKFRVNIKLYPSREKIYSKFSIISKVKVLRSGE